MSKEQRFETLFDGNKWLVADKENDTLLGGFSSAKMLNEFVDKVADLETKLADLQQEQIKEMQEHQEAMGLADKTIKELEANLELHKQSNLVLNDQLNKATEHLGELEDKLEEKERLLEDSIDVHETEEKDIYNLRYELAGADETITQLKQQLADTETQNKRVLEKLELIVRANQELEQKLAEKDKEIKQLSLLQFVNEDNKLVLATTKRINQDKISFAVAELEKAKIEFETYYADNIWNYPQYLEDRIKLLKGEK